MGSKVIDYLIEHQSETPSHWREDAEWRRANRDWLRYSQFIAIRMLSRMEELHMTQTSLAQKMECTQQYVSKVLKGKENLSLETISKIESALEIDLIRSVLTYNSEYTFF
jgi:ribosome-binding protein aMBF1 (putative translation factor)